MRFWKFLQYNNAVPVVLSVLILGGGSAFAATDPSAVYSAQQQVVSIDNTYIANKDLSTYSPQAQITGVTEDADNYYVAYNFSTIDLVNSTWQDITKQLTLKVSKDSLAGTDLGLYVAEQLKENVAGELQRLRNTQEIEKKNVTQKVVATVYGGLVGKMLDSSTETLPGYTPVIAPVLPSLASDATTSAQVASPVVAVTATTTDSSVSGMTQDQIKNLIQQQVDYLLSQHQSNSGGVPPINQPPITQTPAPTPVSNSTPDTGTPPVSDTSATSTETNDVDTGSDATTTVDTTPADSATPDTTPGVSDQATSTNP